MIWVHDPDDEEAMPGTAADERLQSGTADLQSTGTFPVSTVSCAVVQATHAGSAR